MGEAPHEPQATTSGDDDVGGELSAEVRAVDPVEPFGPLTIHRFVKVGGRGLILYERTGPPA